MCAGGCESCKDFFDSGDDPISRFGVGNGVGDACGVDGNCRTGLLCVDATCQPSHASAAGATCQLTGECVDGLYCDPTRHCSTAGMSQDGGDCESTGDCTAGLVCVVEGFFPRCRASGTGDLGDTCTSAVDCLAGLSCETTTGAGLCTSPQPLPGGDGGTGTPPPPAIPFWPGETCTEDTGAPRAYFDVPRPGVQQDFYRLPYPNDVRRTASGLDLSGHPSPGTILPIDVIGRYVDASEEDLRGFALNPVIYFRFSHGYDWGTVGGNIRIVDITEGSPTYGNETGLAWFTTSGMITKYICPNWLAMRTGHGSPLRPGTTYAAIVNTGLHPPMEIGPSFARSPDLTALLGASAPSDSALADAYTKYAPLRAWLTSSMTSPDSILNVAVFTTQEPEPIIPALRTAIRDGAAPAVSDLTVCDGTATSPCDDGTEQRRCGPMNPAYVEIHGRISLPIFQQGTAPYEEPADGGGIMLDGRGQPVVQRNEDVCFALTVPRGVAPPPEGFPLLVVGHGTGGSFTTAVGRIAEVAVNGDATTPMVNAATLAIDLPQHGSRRGMSTRSPDVLFFNFANPRAARDNITQGAADLMSLAYFAEGYAVDAATSPSGQAISFDETRLVMLAHSQGATHASLMLSYEPAYSSAVLSGNGGDLTVSLLNKTEPVNIAGLLPLALLDPAGCEDGMCNLVAGDFHPALALFQQFFERVDPVNFGRHLWREPPMGWTGAHVFATYGTDDHYSVEETLQSYARASSMTLVNPEVVDFGLNSVDGPLSANVTVNMTMRTVGMRQYLTEAGRDGHFVAFEHPQGRQDVERFLAQALSGMVPQIGGP
jgi:hypothetical protein